MTSKEFSDQFDILWNNIASNEAPGLNEYEKSVFLTKAQDELVKSYFNNSQGGNKYQQGFDDSTKRQIDFSMIMRYKEINQINSTSANHFDPRSLVYTLPDDLFLFVNEQAIIKTYNSEDIIYDDNENPTGTKEGSDRHLRAIRQVVPIAYDEYHRLMSRPFKEPLKYQAWRLISSANPKSKKDKEGKNTIYAEILFTSADLNSYYTTYPGKNFIYALRYIKRPKPILLVNLKSTFGEKLSINGENGENYDFDNPCELDPIIHEEILQRSIELAKIAYGKNDDAQLQIAAGQRSE